MQSSISSIRCHQLLKKYSLVLSRLQKAMKNHRFSFYSQAKKQAILQRLSRYERQLKQWGIAVGTSAISLLPASNVLAQPVPVGGEFRVNTYTSLSQTNSSTAMDSDGDFVITWGSNGQDGSSWGIYAQRYNNAGVAQGAEFRVNTYTIGNQVNPAIAMDSDGDFIITWASYEQDGSNWGIYGQRYNNAGIAQGTEFRVNTYTSSYQRDPTIAMDSDGDFVVVWESLGQDGSFFGIYAQRYNNAGVAQGTEFRVNTYTYGNQIDPAIAMDSDGDFIITWSCSDGDDFGISAQRYNNAGATQGSEFRVNTYTTDRQTLPSIAMDSDGDFVITWSSLSQDGHSYGIYAQRYSSIGIALGTEFQVNTYTFSVQKYSTIAMDSDGDFVISWNSSSQDEGGWLYGIYGQRYNNIGIPDGPEFLVNTYTTNSQHLPSIAMDSDGDFVITWSDYVQDGSSEGVYAQRFSHPLFPEIVVQGGAILTNINNGDISPSIMDGTNFGGVLTCNGSLIKTYRIRNTGMAPLNLGLNAVNLYLNTSSSFSVFSQPAATIAPSGQTTFKIKFDPTIVGSASAIIGINNNDPDESPFQFAIAGTGLPDVIPPTADCPEDKIITLNANCQLMVPNGTAIVSDNCGGVITQVQSPPAGTLLPSGEGTVHAITITVTDASGNVSTCAYSAIGDDKTKPTFICPANRNVFLNANCDLVVPFLITPVSDNCGMVAFSQSPTAGTVINTSHLETHLVVFTVDDGRGNSKSCTVTLTAIDKTKPNITCPDDYAINVDDDCELTIPWLSASATDNCVVVTVSQSPLAGTVVASGEGVTHTVYMTATDNAGNTRSCQVILTGNDAIPPAVDCPDDITIECDDYDPDLSVYGTATATDNCTDFPAIANSDNLTGFDLLCSNGVITRTFTATDDAGNAGTCTQTIQVWNDYDYTVAFPADVTLTTCDVTPSTYPVVTGDDCSLVAVSYSEDFFDNIPGFCFKIIRTWTVLNWCTFDPLQAYTVVPTPDQGGGVPWVADNTNLGMFQFEQAIYVTDNTLPTLINYCGEYEFCDYTTNGPYFDNGTENLCEGPVNLSIMAQDNCGDYGLEFDYTIYLDLDGDGTMETMYSSTGVTPFTIQVTQAGGIHTATIVIPNDATWGGQLPYGDHFIDWIVTDACGNLTGCTRGFIVKDCNNPVIYCESALTVNLTGTPPEIQLLPSDLITDAEDNCTPDTDLQYRIRLYGSGSGVPSPSQTSLTLDCSHLGVQEVEVWVGDNEDNWDYCVMILLVSDAAGACPSLVQSGESLADPAVLDDAARAGSPGITGRAAAPEQGFVLLQNAPNPFDEETVVKFYLPEPAAVNFSVWNADGVLLLTKTADFSAGWQEILLAGHELPDAGLLICELSTQQYIARSKMIKL